MAFSGNYVCNSFKTQLLQGVHDFRSTGDTFKIALYTNSASFTEATTAYTATNELSNGSWPAGGYTLTNTSPVLSSGVAISTWSNISVAAAITNARGAMIYNSSVAGNPAVLILDFGGNKTSTTTFAVAFPTADNLTAIVRVS